MRTAFRLTFAALLAATLPILPIFVASTAIHEIGHALAGIFFGFRLRRISAGAPEIVSGEFLGVEVEVGFLPIAGAVEMEEEPVDSAPKPHECLLVQVGGVLANFGMAASLILVLVALGCVYSPGEPVSYSSVPGGAGVDRAVAFWTTNEARVASFVWSNDELRRAAMPRVQATVLTTAASVLWMFALANLAIGALNLIPLARSDGALMVVWLLRRLGVEDSDRIRFAMSAFGCSVLIVFVALAG